jgi:hypothetical protein
VLLGIDHLVIATADPDAAVEDLGAALGLEPGAGGRHPSWGTRNRLLWLGDTFVELLGVGDPSLAATSWLGAPALANRADWPCLVGWAIASGDLDADADRLVSLGADLGPPIAGERRRPDGRVVRWRLALPHTIGLDRPFLIEHDSTSAEWTAADRAVRAAIAGRVTALELPVGDVPGFLARGRALSLGEQTVRAADRPAREPLIRLTGLAPRPEVVHLLGCRWSLG